MAPTPDEQALIERFSNTYERLTSSETMMAIERSVCGCDYGCTSWTTRDEADAVTRRLGLGPDTRLLDVGAGTGWPSIFWAGKTGCQAVCVDLPHEGLQVLRMRAEQDGVSEQIMTVRGNGAALPFSQAGFDAVFHSDVFC